MSKQRLHILLGTIVICALSLAAWWGGTEAGHFLGQSNHEELLEHRADFTKGVLKQMGSIAVGDTLPDYEYFEDLESNMVRLSDAITGPTWLIFVLPDCPECLKELDELRPVLSASRETRVILISNGNPLDLMDLRKHYHLNVPLVHDRNATYTEGIKVFAFPFNILIDKDLVIRELVAGQIEPSDF